MEEIERYLKKLKRALRTGPKIKSKIICDMRADFEIQLAEGCTAWQVIEKAGDPYEVAREFNQNYPEYPAESRAGKIRVLAAVCFAVAAVCLVSGIIGRNVCVYGSWLGSAGELRIGGANAATDIQVVSEPLTALFVYDTLIKVGAIILIAAAVFAVYLIISARKNSARR